MKSWVRLLLLAVLSVAGVRLGHAEDDPLPLSLVDLVRNSPVSTFEDLELLLQQETNALGDKEEETKEDHDILKNQSHSRLPRSLTVEAEEAKPAVCKPRTEVMEVTRSMLDRRNADFRLFPNCVEVQRCSGCCNTRFQRCVPVLTITRYLKVTKLQFINKKAHFTKVNIPVEDHIDCNCQGISPSSSPTTQSSGNINPNPHPPAPQQPHGSSHHPQTVHPSWPQKTQTSKDVLHRDDDLKHNQQPPLSENHEPAARQWPQGSYTQLVHWTPPRLPQAPTQSQSGAHQTIAGDPRSVGSLPSEAKAEINVPGSSQIVPETHTQGSNQRANNDGEVQERGHAQRPQQGQQSLPSPLVPGLSEEELRTHYRLNVDANSPTTHQRNLPAIPIHSEGTDPPQTKTKDNSQKAGSVREDSGSVISGDSAGAESAGQGKDRDNGRFTEEERRPKPPALKPVAAKSTLVPIISSMHQAPPRPALPRGRRKRRKRINKAALRAMIM